MVAPSVIVPLLIITELPLSTVTTAVDEIVPPSIPSELSATVPPTCTFPPEIISLGLFKENP